MIQFVAAIFFLVVTPGPGVMSLAGVGSGFGWRAGLRYLVGLLLGNNLVILAVISGLAALILADDRVRLVLFWLSVAYLLYLAARIALAGSRIAFIERQRAPGIGEGIALQIVNPKAYAVNLALFSGFPILPGAYLLESLVKLLVLNAIWLPIHLVWLYAGVTVRRLDLPAGTQRAINVMMALAMLAVVALAALAAPG